MAETTYNARWRVGPDALSLSNLSSVSTVASANTFTQTYSTASKTVAERTAAGLPLHVVTPLLGTPGSDLGDITGADTVGQAALENNLQSMKAYMDKIVDDLTNA